MGVYDSQRFSKEFSVRTEANLAFIQRAVNQDRLESEYRNTFIAQYRQILEKVKDAVETIRRDANTIPAEQKKGKNKLKSSIYSLATELESNKNALERDLDALVSSKRFENDKLYEVTQLLNSLMGIAVLPYEMHKEIIKPRGNRSDSEEKRREVRDTWEYGQLHSFVMKLYKEGKWTTTYNEDRDSKGNINENTIGFNFLGHLRNAVCHSGDNAISILPLSEGKIIEEILFYDKLRNTGNLQEFAMRLSVKELEILILKVAEFYRNTKIGYIDKTSTIKDAENRVKELLKKSNM